MSRDLLLWCSPKDSPSSRWLETGQGLITRTVIDCSDISTTVISPSLGTYLYAVIRLFTYVLSRPSDSFSVYVVSSRTIPGFIRDLPAFILILFRFRVYAHVHGSDIHRLFAKPFLGCLAFRVYSKLAFVIFPSEYALPRTIHSLKNYVIIENCLPQSVRASSNYQPKSANNNTANVRVPSVSILWNSNLMASKGVVEVLKGFELLTQNMKTVNTSLTLLGKVIGDYEISASLLELILEPYLRKQSFNYVGSVDSATAHLWLLSSDIVVLNTRYRTECQPLAIIAAMCEGKCVVASRHPAIVSSLKDYPHFQIENSSDPVSVFSALSRACSMCLDKSYQKLLADHAAIARQRFASSRFISDFRRLLDV